MILFDAWLKYQILLKRASVKTEEFFIEKRLGFGGACFRKVSKKIQKFWSRAPISLNPPCQYSEVCTCNNSYKNYL